MAECASATAVSSAIHHLFGSPGFAEIADWSVREQSPRRTVDHPVDYIPCHYPVSTTTTPSKIGDQLSIVTHISPGKKPASSTVFAPCCSSDHCLFWRIRAYDFQRVIRPRPALLRCPVVGCSAPSLFFMQGGWDGQENSALFSLIFSRTVAGFALAI